MIELSTLHFRVARQEWEGYHYFFELPGQAYGSRGEALDGIPGDMVAVSWQEMTQRVYKDIHDDS